MLELLESNPEFAASVDKMVVKAKEAVLAKHENDLLKRVYDDIRTHARVSSRKHIRHIIRTYARLNDWEGEYKHLARLIAGSDQRKWRVYLRTIGTIQRDTEDMYAKWWKNARKIN